jgi:4-aminobutyrate aminotransferase-like enzyme
MQHCHDILGFSNREIAMNQPTEGSHILDVEGTRYIDFASGIGAPCSRPR